MLEKLENVMKKECFFEEKTFSFFIFASLRNWEGEKYAGGSRPSCNQTSQILLDVVVCFERLR